MDGLARKLPKGFLRRKFVAPQLPHPYVREERMSSLVADVDAWRVCLINASAGYGKTALMSQWFLDFESRADCVPLWIALDEQDGDVVRFSRGFSYLLGSAVEGFSGSSSEEWDEADADSALIELVNLTDEACDPCVTYIVFFDGYDSVSSFGFDETLLFLNRFCGDNFRFIVSGSYFSPQVDDLLLDSSVIEFRTRDLAFDQNRLRQFAFALMPDLTEVEFSELCAASGMWPTSFVFNHLARKRCRGTDFRKTMEGYHKRFFSKAVMDRIDASTYEFLIETAVLESLDPDLCDRVTGRSDSRGVLEYLTSRNLFIHYEADLGAYVHQPAFRRFLLDKALALHPGYLSKLMQRAGDWHAERGMESEYAKYMAAACDGNYVQGSIRSSTGLTWQGEYASFLEFLLAQPAGRFAEDAYLAWVSIWAFISIGRPEEARSWIAVVRALGESDEHALAYDYADAICLALEGDSRSSLALIRKVLETGGPELPRAFQCLLIHMEGENCERLGNPKKGRDLYLKALSLAERAEGAFYKLFDMYCLAHQHLYVGEFDEAVSVANRALGFCEEGSPLFGEFHAIVAFAHIERGELDEAERRLSVAQRCVSSNANIDMYIDVFTVKARLEVARRNEIEAFEILSDVLNDLDGKRVPRNFDMEVYALLASLANYLDEASVVRRCEMVLDEFMGRRDFLRVVPCMIAKARILRKRGEYEECAALLARCRETALACGSTFFLTELNILEATIAAEDGNEVQASVHISKAVELAMRGGYLTVFLSGGLQSRELMLKLATSRKTSLPIRGYAKKVLLLYGSETEVNADIALQEGGVQGYCALTEREREMLHALNAGMSRRELAESFGVSQNTVKTHLKNIYSKLGVHTRSEAYRASQGEQSQA